MICKENLSNFLKFVTFLHFLALNGVKNQKILKGYTQKAKNKKRLKSKHKSFKIGLDAAF